MVSWHTHAHAQTHTHGRTNWQNVEEQNSAQISRGKKKISSRLSTSSLLVSSSLLSSSASSLGLTFTHHLSYFPFTVAWQQTGTASHGDVKTTGRTCRANHRVDVLLRKLHYTLLLLCYFSGTWFITIRYIMCRISIFTWFAALVETMDGIILVKCQTCQTWT